MENYIFYVCTDQVACADPAVCESVCQSRVGCTNIAYPMLVLELLPSGETNLHRVCECIVNIF